MEEPPEHGQPAAEVLERAAREILPIALRLDHSRQFAFIPTVPTWPGVLADFMAAGYNVNANVRGWSSSGPSQLELLVIDWLRQWIGYPEGAGGLLTSGGSAANLDALVAAREAAGHPERADHLHERPESQRACIRAAKIIGMCDRRASASSRATSAVPSGHGMRSRTAVAHDRAAGFNPDRRMSPTLERAARGPLIRSKPMADYCETQGMWLHVDAAYGGFAVVTERGHELLARDRTRRFDQRWMPTSGFSNRTKWGECW